jgi:FkbM family methyltransferase
VSAREWAGRIALGAYVLGRRSGVLETRVGEALYMRVYMAYKRYVEDSLAALLRRHPALAHGGHIFDVGANIGYTSLLFARAVEAPYRIFAFEPEPRNFAQLERNLARFKCNNVQPYQCAVGRSEGTAALRFNKSHPGDHRIVTPVMAAGVAAGDTMNVPMTSLDSMWRHSLFGESVALVKIDVQGFEHEVVLGMQALLEAERPPVVIFEHDPELSLAMGFDPLAVPRLLTSYSFDLHLITRHGALVPVQGDALARRGSAYLDVVAVPPLRRLTP